ncbi:hypothetical protein QTN47_18350 [Danxiaibacter flavus]|uniref:Uncharacterized protein n=1 Tax=Danxiaibacter flavus TaxID=3049108 RepID=A0ABV3ZIZ8_9BACT|nr:hypothetical protein QNM32_18360 [Chitinophagaceae bacterium DXS]
MKKILMAVVCLLTGYGYLHAQQNTNYVKQPQAIQKGYYGIGNNANKLEQKTPVATLTTNDVSKGYYAISDNKSKLNLVPVVTVGGDKKSSATKGYYAIGDNYKKLTTPGIVVLGKNSMGAEDMLD